MKSARRSLNIMFQEWGNRGLHYWEIDETTLILLRVKLSIIFSEVQLTTHLIVTEHRQPQIKWHQQSLVLMMFWNQRTGQIELKQHNKMLQ